MGDRQAAARAAYAANSRAKAERRVQIAEALLDTGVTNGTDIAEAIGVKRAWDARRALRRAGRPDLADRVERDPAGAARTLAAADAAKGEAFRNRQAILVEDAEFLARSGVGHEEATVRLGRSSWNRTRILLNQAGRGDLADRLLANTEDRLTPADLAGEGYFAGR